MNKGTGAIMAVMAAGVAVAGPWTVGEKNTPLRFDAGAAADVAALTCPKRVTWFQGATHGYVPPKPQKISWSN